MISFKYSGTTFVFIKQLKALSVHHFSIWNVACFSKMPPEGIKNSMYLKYLVFWKIKVAHVEKRHQAVKRKHCSEMVLNIFLWHCFDYLQLKSWNHQSRLCFVPRDSRSKRQTVTRLQLHKALVSQNSPVTLATYLPHPKSQHFKRRTWTD